MAASLIDELLLMRHDGDTVRAHPWLETLCIQASPEVIANVVTKDLAQIQVPTRQKWWARERWITRGRNEFALQWTVFGPRYGWKRAPIVVTGIADVTSVYHWPIGVPKGPIRNRLKRAVRGPIARKLFQGESLLVSESEALLDVFCRRTGYPRERTKTIPNAVNSAVLEAARRPGRDLSLAPRPMGVDYRLVYVARGYPHKNHEFLTQLHAELLLLGVSVEFVVTLSESEWAERTRQFRAVCKNVGVIPVSAVADLYFQCDAVIFPSLLESFSATPIEAMATNGRIFASDRPFVREVCGDTVTYIDPLNPQTAAVAIVDTMRDAEKLESMKERAMELAGRQVDAAARARAFVEVISAILDGNENERATTP
ncbi:glycosyltransferase [Tessaracoccus defluvii]|uniref:Glycosyltransferase n=1 Tax=Tessaracoccus defluvii TaxID=1285901 RepID=A0A7H0H3E5_9ACTN|nr:glycosyltransferase [Tessaracoccus defluvii]QNP55061.1 glycosyltransferase [Tessaracoccus defluvii]